MTDRPMGRSRSILVVEDDPDSADSLALLLEHWNHRVSVAYQGTRAIEVFRRDRPQVTLIDIGLPDIDGYSVARALRREDPSAILIALTGYGDEEHRAEAESAGFDRHFTKPIDTAKLQRLLESL